MIAIDDTTYLLATYEGLLKTSKDQLIKHYLKGENVTSLCHITDSLYLVGFRYAKLIVWDQQKEQEMYHFSEDDVVSIKRVMSTDNYILKRNYDGVKLLTINDLEQKNFTVQHMLDVKDYYASLTDCIQVDVTPSQIVIAVAHNEKMDDGKNKVSIKLMKIPIA